VARTNQGFGWRCVMSSAAATDKRRDLRLLDVIVDRQRLEGGERSDEAIDIILLDELLRLGACCCRHTGCIGDDQINFAPAERAIALFEVHDERSLHVEAAGGEWPGLHRKKPDANGIAALRPRSRHGHAGGCACDGAIDKFTS
jgi:hypothetical protein